MVLIGLVGLAALKIRLVYYPQGDPVVRYHDAAPFRTFFRATKDTWPLDAEVVAARFGVPNLYRPLDKISFTGARPRRNSAWCYQLADGGWVTLHVFNGEVVHALTSSKGGPPMTFEFLRPQPRELAISLR